MHIECTDTVRYVPGTVPVPEAFIFYMRNSRNRICVHKQELSNQAKIDEHEGNNIT